MGRFGGLLKDGIILTTFGVVVGVENVEVEIQFGRPFVLDVSFDFTTAHIFEALCPKLAGDLCCQQDCEAKMDPHFKVSITYAD